MAGYEATKLAEVHRELNKNLGWFTIGRQLVCSKCGAPKGAAGCECGAKFEERFLVNLAQLFKGQIDQFPGATVYIYPASREIEIAVID